MVLVKMMMTWEEALQYCRTSYTDLISVTSDKDLTSAKSTSMNSSTSMVWTGLRFMDGSWLWVNKDPLGNLTSVPSCPMKPYRCGALKAGDEVHSAMSRVDPLMPIIMMCFENLVLSHDESPTYTGPTPVCIIKYTDDTTVVGQISNNDESAYREEIQSLSAWSSINNFTLNAKKTKELIVDFQKSNSNRHFPIYINGSEVEHVSSFKFLGVHISEDLSWHLNTSTLHLDKLHHSVVWQLHSGDSRRMWQGIQVITNYKTTLPACDNDASLPDTLNDFYTWFEAQNNVAAKKTIPPPNDQVLYLYTADVKRTLCRVNPWKSAGPDNIPGRVLRECAEQLADVFTDIFNISLSCCSYVPQDNDHCPRAKEVYSFLAL
ncbi:hypothetical protein QTP86_002361 [Hemibagrus guttatus]|nr:hypothetical protein QTP86_002361 [Hemibagrus guttatus]